MNRLGSRAWIAVAATVTFAALLMPAAHAAAPGGEQPIDKGAVKSAVDKAANWLIDQHNVKEGTFGKEETGHMPGVVGLILTGLCQSHRQYDEAMGPFISEPVKYLLKNRQTNGSIMLAEKGMDTYNTALAMQGLHAAGNAKYEFEINQAKDFLLKCQSKEGGFTYGHGFRQGGDLSNTYIALSGLQAADQKGLEKVYTSSLNFVRRVQDNAETNPDPTARKGDNTGGAYYKPGQSEVGTVKTREGNEVPKPYGSMTAAALQSFLYCGLKADAPEVQAALRWFQNNFSAKENPGAGDAGYYYYVMTAARAFSAAGVSEIQLANGKKVRWSLELAKHLIPKQAHDGSFEKNENPRWLENDQLLCTAYALNALNLIYADLKK